jgi:hypothetical protein
MRETATWLAQQKAIIILVAIQPYRVENCEAFIEIKLNESGVDHGSHRGKYYSHVD